MKIKKRIIVLLVWIVFIVSSCAPKLERTFLDQDLLFDASVVPPGWELVEVNEIPSGETEGQISGAYKTYYNALTPYWDRFGEDVYRYAKVSQAKWNFKHMEKELFNDKAFHTTTTWQSPEEFTFTSQSADQWRFGCAGNNFLHENDVDCIYLAQYDEFIIRMIFAHWVKEQESLSLEDIQRIVTHVDELVTLKLGDEAK